jgi:hypothetical protein
VTRQLAARLAILAVAGLGSLLGRTHPLAAEEGARFVRQHDWNPAEGIWLKIDTHVHSTFSDGAWTVEELVAAAAQNGCDAVAITDHADHSLRGASQEYFAELNQARRQHPDCLVLAGLEWNIPPHRGSEHVTILVEPTPDEAVILAEFKDRFDDFEGDPRPEALAVEALAWLAEKAAATNTLAVVAYNHPGRKRESLEPFREEFLRLRAASPLLIGFEGGVGHQAGRPLGAYEGPVQLEERWDPAAATVGSVWDQLLGQGVDAWAALATSDFHNDQGGGVCDYPPGRFSETWVSAPERTARGVLRALQSGSFFGAHGHIVRQVRWTVTAPALPRPAEAGEAIRVPPGVTCRAAIRMEIPRWDWQDVANKVDVVELIAVDEQGATVVKAFDDVAPDKELDFEFIPPDGGVALRARGRRDVFQKPDYLFMTNPIRILVD